jgi:hypothetical protein
MRTVLALTLLLSLVCFVGCNDGISVSGTVKAGGSPLPKGHIGFAPAEGGGETFGTEVVNGEYSITGMTAGKKKVTIVSTSDSPAFASREEASAAGSQGTKPLIPLDHPKNGQIVDVTSGSTTLDFDF